MSNKESREEDTSETEQVDKDTFVFMGREAKPLTPDVTVVRSDEEESEE